MNRLAIIIVLLVGCGSSGSWSEQPVPEPTALTTYTVWVAGDNDVWLGGSAIWHFDGSSWTESAPGYVAGFWGFSPSDIFAVSDHAVRHWDGSAWTDMPATNGVTFAALYRVWGASKNDLWIANTDNSRVYHYDGTQWSVTTLQFVAATGLWGTSASDIWLSGTFNLYHYDGTSWMQYQGNDDPHGVYGFWGAGPSDVWAAGGFNGISHWNGSAWTAPEENLDADFNGVWGAAADDIYAVGDNGAFGHYDGSSWSVSQELDVRENFTMVHGSSRENLWATSVDVGALKAKVLRYEP
ncbi:hypothetical protein BH11MYX3_BH11MYX3_00190 [soil metagenome]